MTNIVKEKIRAVRDDVRTLTLKKESLQDKVRMQNEFIQEIESRSKEPILRLPSNPALKNKRK